MDNNPFLLFIDLINFDQKVLVLEKDIEKIRSKIAEAANQTNSSRVDLESNKSEWTANRKDVDEKELRMKILNQSEEDKKNKQEFTTTPKEYAAVKKEIEKIKQAQYELEPILLESWNKSESSKKDYEIKKTELENKINLFQ